MRFKTFLRSYIQKLVKFGKKKAFVYGVDVLSLKGQDILLDLLICTYFALSALQVRQSTIYKICQRTCFTKRILIFDAGDSPSSILIHDIIPRTYFKEAFCSGLLIKVSHKLL